MAAYNLPLNPIDASGYNLPLHLGLIPELTLHQGASKDTSGRQQLKG